MKHWRYTSRLLVEIVHIIEIFFIFCCVKLVVEPSGAAPVAAVLSERFATVAKKHNLKRVAVVISGGNVDLASLPW